MEARHLSPRKTPLPDKDSTRGPLRLYALNDPRDPFVELIFVHGLLGDSRLTWTQDNDSALFWPSWLAEDKAFQHVRIHTYGYNVAQPGRRVSVSKIGELGTALCADLSVSPYLKGDAQNPIVFVAHSLGGLVVKSAIIHAKQSYEFRDLADRLHTIFFLATPHREADNLVMLREILRACDTSAPNEETREPDLRAACIEDINSTFHSNYNSDYCDIRVWCFYETLPTWNQQVSPVIEKQRAVFDLSRQQMSLNAHHAGIARFQSLSDPGYCSIRDSLVQTIEDIQTDLLNPERVMVHMDIIRAYLGTSEDDEKELPQKTKAQGSCKWLLQKPSFIKWRDMEARVPSGPGRTAAHGSGSPVSKHRSNRQNTPQLFWLTGLPGTGKTFLANEVVRDLKAHNCECSFYFLKHRDKARQNLGALLKSIACQMANRHTSVRRLLLSFCQQQTFTAEANDFQTIWRQLFEHGIFHIELPQRQYWVIDALDEGKAGQELIPLLAGLPPRYKVFLTSRQTNRLESFFKLERIKPIQQQVEKEETLKDIRTYLEEHEDDLDLNDDVERSLLIDQLVEKSNGSFLWAHLVVQRLRTSFGEEDMRTVIDNIPKGMHSLYIQILSEMAYAENAKLARAILRWVVCAARPLTVSELRVALRLDSSYGQTVRTIERAIEVACGQLVIVEDSKAMLVHDTIGNFLLDEGQEQLDNPHRDIRPHHTFAIRKLETHAQLAITCLQHLIAGGKAVLGTQFGLATLRDDEQMFHDYSREFFSEHIYKSVAKEGFTVKDRLMRKLLEFLKGAVLDWIEVNAQKKDLSPLTATGKNLKKFVECSAGIQAPLDPELKAVKGWADDLIHLVTVFGDYLLNQPSSVHMVIPALCPPESMIFQEFANQVRGMEVTGLSVRTWPARISSFSFSPDYATALACCEKLYAVGLRSKEVVLYQPLTCQEIKRLVFEEPVEFLEFARSKEFLVVCGRKMIAMYNYESGAQAWTTLLPAGGLAVTITEDDSKILVAGRDNQLHVFAAGSGQKIDSSSWAVERSQRGARPPQRVNISTKMSLLALTYRNKPLALHDLRDPRPGGSRPVRYVECSASVEAVAFNPAGNALAMGSFDGELCVIGIGNLHKIATATAHASHLAVSTDGRTLIVGTKTGNVQIHDFHSLALLHVIRYDDEELVSLAIESNGLRFLDIRRQVFNVWEPSALVRRKDDDDSTSEGRTSFSTAPSQLVEAYLQSDQSRISAIVCHHSGEYILCGRENGTVTVHEAGRGKPRLMLYEFDRTAVTFMDWNAERQLLVSADRSSTIWIHRVTETQERSSSGLRKSLRVEDVVNKVLQHPIRQVLFSVDGDYVIVSTTEEDSVFWTTDLSRVTSHECTPISTSGAESQKWTVHHHHKRQFFAIERSEISILTSDRHTNNNLKTTKMIPEPQDRHNMDPRGRSVHFLRFGQDWCAIYDKNPNTAPVIWNQEFVPDSHTDLARLTFQESGRGADIKSIVGVHGSRLVFLNSYGWICSTSLYNFPNSTGINHYPVPHYWRTSARHTLALITSKGDVVFALEGELAIVKRGLQQ